MRKWWRRFKNNKGWDFSKITHPCWSLIRENGMVLDDRGIYSYKCKYCGLSLTFPWRETPLAYHNMQRHIKAKHIDIL